MFKISRYENLKKSVIPSASLLQKNGTQVFLSSLNKIFMIFPMDKRK
jgi:hypothetical protein